MDKYPDRMAGIPKKHNVTIKTETIDVDMNTDINYFNNALCKMSKSIFFDHEISYCSKDDINESIEKKYDILIDNIL